MLMITYSTSGYCLFLGLNLVSWHSHKHHIPCLNHLLRQNIRVSLPWLLRSLGYTLFIENSASIPPQLQSSNVTTLVHSMLTLNILRLISISFGKKLFRNKFTSIMFLLLLNLLMSSPRLFPMPVSLPCMANSV